MFIHNSYFYSYSKDNSAQHNAIKLKRPTCRKYYCLIVLLSVFLSSTVAAGSTITHQKLKINIPKQGKICVLENQVSKKFDGYWNPFGEFICLDNNDIAKVALVDKGGIYKIFFRTISFVSDHSGMVYNGSVTPKCTPKKISWQTIYVANKNGVEIWWKCR